MKTFFKYLGIFIGSVLLLAYLCFLIVLPRFDIAAYKGDLQKIVKDQTNLNLNFENLKLYTTPLLEIGVKGEDLSVKLPDDSTLLSAESFKGKVAIPSVLFMTAKVSGLEVNSPKINLDIVDDKQFKVVSLVEDILNNRPPAPQAEESPLPIRVKVSNVRINNYSAVINDTKHTLSIKGEKLLASYNVDKVRVRTEAKFFSDEDNNINLNVDVDALLPEPTKLDAEDDKPEKIEIPFVNPISVYRDYNLKADVNTKLKIRKNITGFLDVENFSMHLKEYDLPKSYIKAKFRGQTADIDTNLYITPQENIQILGKVNYSSNPKMNLAIVSEKIHLDNVVLLAKAFLNTLQIPNDLAQIKAGGYIQANTKIKTNFKKMKAEGSVIAREGQIFYKKTGLVVQDMNANLLFDNDALNISDTFVNINGSLLKMSGSIDKKSIADISVNAKGLPLVGLYNSFAPDEIKNQLALNSAFLAMDLKLEGKLKNLKATLDTALSDVSVLDKKSKMLITNKNARVEFLSAPKVLSGKFTNNDFKIYIPQTKSTIHNPLFTVNIDDKDIVIPNSITKINNSSTIDFGGTILGYSKKPLLDFKVDGFLNSNDLMNLAGKANAMYLRASGVIPMKATITGDAKRQYLVGQIKSDSANYFSPVEFSQLLNKQTIMQAKVDFKGNRFKVKETGIYSKAAPTAFGDDLALNLEGAKEIASVSGTVVQNFINVFKITLNEELDGKLYALKNSMFKLNGKMFVFGHTASPSIRGEFSVRDVRLPELFVNLDELVLRFRGKRLDIDTNNLMVNGSDIKIHTEIPVNQSGTFTISDLNISSNNMDVDKLMKVTEALSKITPPAPKNAAPANIPLVLSKGSVDIKTLKATPLVLKNTTANISLRRNIFHINNISTSTLEGTVNGRIGVNLLNSALKIKLRGHNFNCEKTLMQLARMKDAVSGRLSFDTDISLSGATLEQQMKSLKGAVNFKIKDGKLGPFGKIENLILAENIRESEFFKTTLGSMISSMTSIESSHFYELNGHLIFKDGIAAIDPITTDGPVMCVNLSGTLNLLTNAADMKLRGRLASKMTDALGPIAAVNPINLVKATPGFDVVAAKAFAFFCEEISSAEMDAIPDFNDEHSKMGTTKFQVVLRGDTAKPLTLVKSFKWLVLADEMASAQAYVATLPTDEEIAAAKLLEEQERIKQEKQQARQERKEKILHPFKHRKQEQKAD